MDNARTAWITVADKVESLGLKLKLHLDQEAADDVDERVQGETRSAFDELTGRVTDAFDAFGNAARDDGVVSDVREIAELIKHALVETFRAVGAEVGELIEQIEDYAERAAEQLADAAGVEVDLDADQDAGDPVEPAAAPGADKPASPAAP